MLDMALFRRGPFSGAVLVNLLSVIGLVGFLYFVAQHLQLIVGLSPLQAGLALVPGLLAMIVAGLGVVPIAKRVAPRIVVPVALSFSILGYLCFAAAKQVAEDREAQRDGHDDARATRLAIGTTPMPGDDHREQPGHEREAGLERRQARR